jgi:hypothetical protein
LARDCPNGRERIGGSRCSEIRIGQRVEVRGGRVPHHVEEHVALKPGPGLTHGEAVAGLSRGRHRLSAERGKYLGAKRDQLRPKPAKTARPKKERGRKMLRRLAASDASHAGNTSSNLVGVTKKTRDSDFGRSPLVRCGKCVSPACTLDLAPVQVRDTFGVLLKRLNRAVPSANIKCAWQASFEPINAVSPGKKPSPGCARATVVCPGFSGEG